MKIADLDNPVRAGWLAEQGFRLDARPYVSQAYAARAFLRRLPRTDPLGRVTARIFHPGRVKRQWTTDPAYGVPFLGSADIFEADLSWLPLMATAAFKSNSNLPLEPGWTLITRSGMTAGRVTCARPGMAGYACSEDVLRVVPDPAEIPSGYLYAFLASPFGIPMIKGGIYGTSVRHIEPHHIADLPVPRLGDEVETRIHELMEQAAELRERFQAGIVGATRDLFKSAGLAHLLDLRWHDQPRDLDFEVHRLGPTSLRALNYSPRAQRILAELASVPHRTLGDICAGGSLRTGARFKRVDADPEHGIRLIGQRQAFWLRPEGRWINASRAPADIRQADETVLVAAHGTLGETEVFARSIFVTGRWLDFAFSQDFVRVLSGQEDLPGAYLYALLRSEAAFRMLRSMSVGGKQQEFHPTLLRRLPVPECTVSDRRRIAETVRGAFRDRDEADRKEDQAMALLDEAVRKAAR
ncbi:MAG: restriction endonuclease subunit S [Frankia sp.]|nr:restriction endonuclease subunit S [Frankia sp.]